MAYESVKNQIDAYIKANGVNLITGPVLNAVLTTMLDELGEGYAFQGVLDTTDIPSPAADIPQAWLASAGTYLGGSITVDEGELALIIHAADGWSKETVYRGVQLSHDAIVYALGYTPADEADLAEKQDKLISGKNVKTINGVSIIGAGDLPIEGNGDDINFDANKRLQFANRPNTDGMGYVILRKGKTFAEQVTDTNTIYEIRDSFDLSNASITIPNGSILCFNGGKISNGVLSVTEFCIVDVGKIGILENIQFVGNTNFRCKVDWYIKSYNTTSSGTYDNTTEIQDALNSGCKEICFPIDKFLYITNTLTISGDVKLVTENDGNGMVNHRNDDFLYGIVTDKDITMMDYTYSTNLGGDSMFIGRLNFINKHYGWGYNGTEKSIPVLNIVNNSSVWGMVIACNVHANTNYVAIKIHPNGTYLQGIRVCGDFINAYKGLELLVAGTTTEYITDVTFDVKDVVAVVGADFGKAAEIRIMDNCYQPAIFYDSANNGAAFFVGGGGILRTAFVWDLAVVSGGKYTCEFGYDVNSYNLQPSLGTKAAVGEKIIDFPHNMGEIPIGGVYNIFNVARNQYAGYGIDGLVYTIDSVNILKSANLFNGDLLFGEPSYPLNVPPLDNANLQVTNRAYFKSGSVASHDIHIEFNTQDRLTNMSLYGITIDSPYTYSYRIRLYAPASGGFESEPYLDKSGTIFQKPLTIFPRSLSGYTKVVFDFTSSSRSDLLLPMIYTPFSGSVFGLSRVNELPNTEIDGKIIVHKNMVMVYNRTKKQWRNVDDMPALAKVGTSERRPWFVTAEAGFMYFDTTNNRPEWSTGAAWIDYDGEVSGILRSGTTAERPTPSKAGFVYFDTTLNKPIWYAGSGWVDATGATV